PLHVPGLWAVETLHSTATLSSEGVHSLYRLRLMHRLNIFLFHHGHSGWVGLLFCWFAFLTLTLVTVSEYTAMHQLLCIFRS
ncbi:hypothetical protein M405DRAFT_738442, partial [Rhizopogon salebrosus TDB-379]